MEQYPCEYVIDSQRTRILVRLGLYYFVVMGVVLFAIQFIFPAIFPSIESYVTTINDILVFVLTPLLVMYILNYELMNLPENPSDHQDLIREILNDLEGLSVSYGDEDFDKKKGVVRKKLLKLSAM